MILDILNSNDDFAAKIFDSLFYSLQIVFAKKPPQLFQLLPETLQPSAGNASVHLCNRQAPQCVFR